METCGQVYSLMRPDNPYILTYFRLHPTFVRHYDKISACRFASSLWVPPIFPSPLYKPCMSITRSWAWLPSRTALLDADVRRKLRQSSRLRSRSDWRSTNLYLCVSLRCWHSSQLGADLIMVAAFGQILPKAVLNLPPKGCLNVHASLLPRWRGASPIQAAIAAGDDHSGVTIMLMDEGLDTGPILSQRSVPLPFGITGSQLSKQLAELGARTLIEILPSYLQGMVAPLPQSDKDATYAPMLKKSDGLLNFDRTALELARQVNALPALAGHLFQLQRPAAQSVGGTPARYVRKRNRGTLHRQCLARSGHSQRIAGTRSPPARRQAADERDRFLAWPAQLALATKTRGYFSSSGKKFRRHSYSKLSA